MNANPLADRAADIARSPRYVKENYFRPKEELPGYLRYRLYRPFLKVYHNFLIRRHPGAPWLCPAAVAILERILTSDMIGFEFGSGRSTTFFARRIKHLTSIEHDPAWYRSVKEQMSEKNILNVDYRLLTPDEDTLKPGGYPASTYEDKIYPPTPATCYTNYFESIVSFPSEYFDFVVVDGRARTECAALAFDKIKRGGFLMLDNAERYRYRPIHERYKRWQKVSTTSGLTDTVFWFNNQR